MFQESKPPAVAPAANPASPAAKPGPAEAPTKVSASAPKRPAMRVSDSLEPIRPAEFGIDEARHLLSRAGFGGSPGQLRTLADWGPEKSVDYLLNFDAAPGGGEPIDESAFDRDIMRPPNAEERQAQRRAAAARDEETLAQIRVRRQNAEQSDREQVRAMQRWWLKRMIETGRPLEEKLTLFWHGHFATSYRTVEDSYLLYKQNLMFRKHAAGNFGDLLFGIIRDPAMINYLDNNDSRRNKPNENLAREIMELFSLGVGNYTEQDIKEGARALTGYTYKDNDFDFDRPNHDPGNKAILDRVGSLDGEDFVGAILEQRECARFIALKLYRFFAHDYPSGRAAVDDAAKNVTRSLGDALLRAKYEVKPVLRRLFLSRHFYDPALRNQQIKSPVQLLVGTIRALGSPARDLKTLLDATNMMGQSLFFPPSVKGWDGGRSWMNTSTLFVRQNTLVYLLTGKRPQGRDPLADDEPFDGTGLLEQIGLAYPEARETDLEARLDAILRFSVGTRDVAARDTLRAFLAQRGASPLDGPTLTNLILLTSALPEFQLC